jgi:hypothetical protein
MKRLSYSQMVLGLDQLLFGGKLENIEQAEECAATIEAYMQACGWTWDELLNYKESSN